MSHSQVIAVDLDGTLTPSDTLYESVLSLLSNKPYFLIILPFWLCYGIANLKQKVAAHSNLDVATLPYNQPLIDWLNEEKRHGKKIVLCTAANEEIARAVCGHFRFFDEYLASDFSTNLKGARKRNALQQRYGLKRYDYAGNSSDDLEVWVGASNAIVVNSKKKVLKMASQLAPIARVFDSEKAGPRIWLKALRVHQWLKNLLLFIPLIAAHQISDIRSIGLLMLAFFSFSLCASSVYITNDLLDLKNDRRHPRKRFRPFASAKLPISTGLLSATFLIACSFTVGAVVGSNFLMILAIYLVLTVAYSLGLKRLVLVDCMVLAMLFTLRIIAGSEAASIPLSFWLLVFSILIFFSLALVKRHAELQALLLDGNDSPSGRGYVVADAPLLQVLGVSSGYCSALVILLYLRSDNIISLYAQPLAIGLLIPVLLFWVSWIWLKSSRGEMHDDPILFAVRDTTSLLVGAMVFAVLIFAAIGMDFLD